MITFEENMYLNQVTETCQNEGWKVADNLNKLALSGKHIDVELYSKAARIIVRAYLQEAY